MAELAPPRFLPAGQAALLVELEDLGGALTLLDLLLAAPPTGIEEVVPAARTVLIRFDPLLTTAAALAEHVSALDLGAKTARAGRDVEIPVRYDGPDLGDVAGLLGISEAELVRRHQEADYKVAFCGFAPGFAYLSGSDAGLAAPRRASPRKRIPAGSVALAGAFCGVYPSDSPGGWQLLGTTPALMWDLGRERPALLAPGDRVRFRDMARGAQVLLDPPVPAVPAAPTRQLEDGLEILQTDRPILFQDLGRFGEAAQGVSRSGAADRGSLRLANRLVGNASGTPALEILLGGVRLRAGRDLTLALGGAPAPLWVTTPDGKNFDLAPDRPFALSAEDVLTIGTAPRGLFSYLALRGGFEVAPVLHSASFDTLAKIGPTSLVSGAHLAAKGALAMAVATEAPPARALPRTGEITEIDVVLGPRDDWFTAEGLATFSTQVWQVTPDSNRVGKRLSGQTPVERRDEAELASEATLFGSIQIPHNGQPVLFLCDHPLTGGYPVIAVVASYHLDLAAQIPPGGRIRFRPVPAPSLKADT